MYILIKKFLMVKQKYYLYVRFFVANQIWFYFNCLLRHIFFKSTVSNLTSKKYNFVDFFDKQKRIFIQNGSFKK